MSWLEDLGEKASKTFAGDKLVLIGVAAGVLLLGAAWWLLTRFGVVDPIFGCEKCRLAKLNLVLVEFADKPGSLAAFGGVRPQYVNLPSYGVIDPQVTTAYQISRVPAIVVKVAPPGPSTVTLRLLREDRTHGFAAGSETLSAREQALEHLSWTPVATATVQTDDNGDGLLDPGMRIPALGGFRYRIEGSVSNKPFVRSANAVNVRRRIAIRPVVRYVAGQAAAFTALSDIRSDLDPLDVEVFTLPTLSGAELGVCEEPDLAQTLRQIGADALNSPNEVKAFNPHGVTIIVGEFITDPMTPQSFERDIPRPASGPFPLSVPIQLAAGGFVQYVVPLGNGTQFQGGSISFGTPPVAHDLHASEVQGIGRFGDQVSVDLNRFMPLSPSVTTITVSVKLKTIASWAVGWAYVETAVIYLNMRDPKTNAILSAEQAAALVIHELGHKLLLSSDGAGSRPDKPAHYYPSFNRNGIKHQGPHCSSGVPDGTDLATTAAHDSATCTMWGSLKQIRLYCAECRTTLRKVDLSAGF